MRPHLHMIHTSSLTLRLTSPFPLPNCVPPTHHSSRHSSRHSSHHRTSPLKLHPLFLNISTLLSTHTYHLCTPTHPPSLHSTPLRSTPLLSYRIKPHTLPLSSSSSSQPLLTFPLPFPHITHPHHPFKTQTSTQSNRLFSFPSLHFKKRKKFPHDQHAPPRPSPSPHTSTSPSQPLTPNIPILPIPLPPLNRPRPPSRTRRRPGHRCQILGAQSRSCPLSPQIHRPSLPASHPIRSTRLLHHLRPGCRRRRRLRCRSRR